jgi:hypothetical protein
MAGKFGLRLRIAALTVAAALAGCGGDGDGLVVPNPLNPLVTDLALDVSAAGSVAGGATERYGVAVAAGAQYVASLTGISGDADLRVYTDGSFTTQTLCAAANTGKTGTAPEDCTVTAAGGTLYVAAFGAAAGANGYRIRVSAKNSAAAAGEGTILYPIAIDPNVPRKGTVGTAASATSYYKVSAASGSIGINLTGLVGTQDIDLRIYSNSNFTDGLLACPHASLGGTAAEDCVLAGGVPYYVRVVNNAAAVGGAYTLAVDSPNDPASGVTLGTSSGLGLDSAVSATAIRGVLNRYSVVPVASGTAYVASLTGISGDADLRVYSDGTYTTRAACASPNTQGTASRPEDCVVTPTANALYLAVHGFGTGTNAYRLRVAPKSTRAAESEGDIGTPLVLTPGNPHAGAVGSAFAAASYYRVTTSAAGSIHVAGLVPGQDVTLQVYNDPAFTDPPETCSYAGTAGAAPEECALAAGSWYLRVTNSADGVGGPYLLTVD